jgi:hypothetical protein
LRASGAYKKPVVTQIEKGAFFLLILDERCDALENSLGVVESLGGSVQPAKVEHDFGSGRVSGLAAKQRFKGGDGLLELGLVCNLAGGVNRSGFDFQGLGDLRPCLIGVERADRGKLFPGLLRPAAALLVARSPEAPGLDVAGLDADGLVLGLLQASQRLCPLVGLGAVALKQQFPRLGKVAMGSKVCTSKEALQRFFDALVAMDRRRPPAATTQPRVLSRRPITSRARQRALANADTVLQRAGL